MIAKTKYIDYIGVVINSITILNDSSPKKFSDGYRRKSILCKCHCGREFIALLNKVMRGVVKSCGCKRLGFKHGMCRTPEYDIWIKMRGRCHNKEDKAYKWYGGRGIAVCDRWFNSFDNFLLDMGVRPSTKHSLDRIDNSGGYSPENCRWATWVEQARNRTNNVYVNYNGEVYKLVELCELLGVNYKLAIGRVTRGWDIEKSLFHPKGKRGKYKKTKKQVYVNEDN